MSTPNRTTNPKACWLLCVALIAGLLTTAAGCDPEERSSRSARSSQPQERQREARRPATTAPPLRQASVPVRETKAARRPAPAEPTKSGPTPLGQSNPAPPGALNLELKPVSPAGARTDSAGAAPEPVKIDRVTLEVLKELHRAWSCDEPSSAPPAGKS